MALRIVKATEVIPVEHPIFLIFGEPGIGKSSLGFTAEMAVNLNTDDGAHRAVNRQATIMIEAWTDADGLTAEFLAPYQTILIDTVGRVLDLMAAEISLEKGCGKGGGLTLQGFGVMKTRFAAWLTRMRALGKDIVLIAHGKEEKDGDTRLLRADITGGSYQEIMKLADFVGYAFASGNKRMLSFSPTDQRVGKNPAGWPDFEIPHYAKDNRFLAGLITKGKEALGKISEASANAANALLDWQTVFKDFKSAVQFNGEIPKVKSIADMALQVQVVKIMIDTAEAKGVKFLPEQKRFADPAPPVTTQQQPATQGALL